MAVIAAVYALFLVLFILKTVKWRQLPRIFGQSAIQYAQVVFCVCGASVFGWLLAFQVPETV